MQTRLEAPAEEPRSLKETAVAVRGASFAYDRPRHRRGGGAPVTAIASFDLDVRPGEVVAVVGPSGCGKTTLLELVGGLLEPEAGTVAAGGATRAADRRRACALMPQRDLLLPWRDALSNAGLALECAGRSRREARRLAAPLFVRFGLAEFERAYPAELSGGMRQRVAFLRTLLAGRPVLLLDEPFGSLDSLTRASMQSWLAEALAADRRTVLLVTHDVDEALLLADRVAILSPRPGRVIQTLPVGIPRPRPRRETLSDPAFAALRERALEALGC
jgi:ABC-type nitrate/sulfonate/bicarbonate transport system ATPase subunit